MAVDIFGDGSHCLKLSFWRLDKGSHHDPYSDNQTQVSDNPFYIKYPRQFLRNGEAPLIMILPEENVLMRENVPISVHYWHHNSPKDISTSLTHVAIVMSSI